MDQSSAKAYSVLKDKEASEPIDSASFRKPVIVNAERICKTATSANTTGTCSLNQLLERQDIWRGQQWQQQHVAYPTGFSLLDKNLADNGWPQIGVCEILCDGVGQGELSIVLPLLKQLISHCVSSTQINDSMVMLVAPPHIPSPQALLQQGLDVERLIWIDTEERKERLWSIEQALASGSVPLVLAWLDSLSITEARRLQLAAEKGQALCMLYLPTTNAQLSHPVNLRLVLQRQCFSALNANDSNNKKAVIVEASMLKLVPKLTERQQPSLSRFSNSHLGMTEINIIKRRGGWPSPVFSLPLLPPHLKESLLGVSACLIDNASLNDDLSGSASLNIDLIGQDLCQAQVSAIKGLADYRAVISSPLLPSTAGDKVLSVINTLSVTNKSAAVKVTSSRRSILAVHIDAVNAERASKKANSSSVIYHAAEAERENHLSLQLEPTRRLSLQPTYYLKAPLSELVSDSIEQATLVTPTLSAEVKRHSQPSLAASYNDSAQDRWTESYKTLQQGAPTSPSKIH
ncbi:translesion DNA synthesis-associated protein ImuA [Shewanella sp. GutDb-MelDb]|uniref:translesion DNA synthesis-associated protein ImuA n=1 Tax=Shewanella sp. GutDb-MelDb TaxID=2058316 RepID=UPI000C7CE01C|nr:translesion DNA synthesis-associated protein ImuA [Shewanella sp. GutDb-MelDb]PKG57950.1 hypothetical protein CXF82_07045 [Shewanella sp. GutDb-MelDb]